MDSDGEDFVFVGTPIETEEDNISRKKKSVAQASGQLRTLVPWKQEVRDEEGRRRFHGAFTGGYSAGFYNTVGSKEGWTPQSFSSSRKNRAEITQQNILNFLDDDEKAEMEGNLLGTSSKFDTFGFTAAEHARKQAEKEQKQRPAPIPGLVPDEIILPAADSIGVNLLLKMGWRRGRSIKESHSTSLHDARREGRRAFLSLSSHDMAVQGDSTEVVMNDLDATEHPVNEFIKSSETTTVHVRQPKQDLHGLGYDPYKHAPEFREKKNSGLSGSRGLGNRRPFSVKDDLLSSRSGRLAPGFGIGALEEHDVEDDDVYSSGYNFEETYVQEVEELSGLTIENKEMSVRKEQGGFLRFRAASNSDYMLERFNPPVIPEDFVPHHKFLAPLDVYSQPPCSPPPEVPPPADNNLKVAIEGVASLVARCGKLFEDLSRERNQSNPLFSFLSGGSGSEYYTRKLWEEQQKRHGQPQLLSDEKPSSGKQKLTAEERGRTLGEKPLERSCKELTSGVSSGENSQFNLSNTFTTPESLNQLVETTKPFKDDPAKQGRFEQFLREKYQGGLRSTYSSGSSNMSEAARARERLDFEAAAESMEKSKRADKSKLSAQQLMDFTSSRLQFTSAGVDEKSSPAEELSLRKLYPKREEFEWRPAPLLCKRFDIMDPYMGKPPPPPRSRSKMDSLIFTSESVKSTKTEDTGVNKQSSLSQFNSNKVSMEKTINAENDVPVEVENVERPVDLYKAIFSDESDTEEEISNLNQVDDPQKKNEAATATFSRLVAGDFLESLGKELGLEVPPDLPLPTGKTKPSASQRTNAPENAGGTSATPLEDISPPAAVNSSPEKVEGMWKEVDRNQETGDVKFDKREVVDKKARRSSGRHYYDDSDSSSSEVEKSKKKSRRRHRRSNSPDSRKRSHDRSHRRKNSSSHKRSQEDSPGSSYHSRDRDRSEREGKKHRKRR